VVGSCRGWVGKGATRGGCITATTGGLYHSLYSIQHYTPLWVQRRVDGEMGGWASACGKRAWQAPMRNGICDVTLIIANDPSDQDMEARNG